MNTRPHSSPLPGVMIALGCSLFSGQDGSSTRSVEELAGIRTDATSSQFRSHASFAALVREVDRRTRIKSLRGKYKGRLPSVDEYLESKRREAT